MKGFKVFNIIVILAMMLAFIPGGSSVAKAQSTGFTWVGAPTGDYVPGQVVVKLSTGKTLSAYASAAASLAGKVGASAVKVGADGMALMQGDANADITALVTKVKSQPGVVYAEPNYIYRLPVTEDNTPANTPVVNSQFITRQSKNGETNQVAISDLKGLKSVINGKITATYPNDPNLWDNYGWSAVGADIVSSNTTASAGICEIDTGVDYNHPDLKGRITKGYDYVNNDADPMDDNGHGTHVAGIITAVANNKIGIAGASSAKIVAVKALRAQGWGTNYDIASAINFCASRTDVKVITMSLGGPASQMIYNALSNAINTKGKLVTAAAGNDGTDDTTNAYPAAFTVTSTQGPALSSGLVAVAASGAVETSDSTTIDYSCKADYSNYGSWVTIIAPGTDILSTTPYSTPFYLNYYYGIAPQYDKLSGTSMATPFVAAAAARRWGYKSTETNAQLRDDLTTYISNEAIGDGSCWPAENNKTPFVNVAALLDRGAASGYIYNAQTGVPLLNAQLQAYLGTALQGSGTLSTIDTAYTEIINLPDTYPYTFKVNASGYTNGSQPAFQHANTNVVYGGWWMGVGRTAIPAKSANFDVVTGWFRYITDYANNPSLYDLDMNVWLPSTPNPLDAGQVAPFIVGMEGNAFGYLENDPTGTLNAFPFATLQREGGYMDDLPFEDVTVMARQAHSPLAANSALPYYPGTYDIQVTDYGQTIDQDNDSSTPEIPLMGVFMQPYVYIWKDGAVKLYVIQNGGNPVSPGAACNSRWWDAATITSGVSGTATYQAVDSCNASQAYGTFSTGGASIFKK
jgi:subtilisin family serine protease